MSEIISLAEWRENQAKNGGSSAPSTPNTEWDQAGLSAIDVDPDEYAAVKRVHIVVTLARTKPFTTKSDFARMAANEVAIAASEGFITTRVNDEAFSNVWIITQAGLEFVEGFNDVFGS